MIKEIQPINHYTSHTTDYYPQWVSEGLEQAWSQLARDNKGSVMPHCSTLLYDIGIADLWKPDKPVHGTWTMKVYVFNTDSEMNTWMEQFGEDKIIDVFYNRL